ncbi:hypothetical protein [Limimaricola hongkongensis]|uniref:Uncharacterized protein n=1 Tax=Limimaricola hongkongensis DSM 17492 TaxID=1122180 RepID=A0A017HF13_9RHOB|nr:hypothetical protein [Limimaricola hongkongensis]EYD72389.1 hypothetical protein Lokhon_01185 [Limimaricola hongkongensis DSM 17492]
MTMTLPRPFHPLRRLAGVFAPRGRARDPHDAALCDELQSMRHAQQVLRLRELRLNRHLARDIGLEPDADPCKRLAGPGGRLF